LEAAGRRLMVVATPADHEVVKATIERLEATLPDEESRFEVYTVHGADAAGLVATLQPLTPGARLTVDPKTNNLLVWATAREHETLKKAVGRLGRGGAAEFATRLEVYRLTKADPASTVALLRGLAPGAKLSIDAPTRSVIAVATERDHQTIKMTLEQLESDEPRPDAAQLRYYPLLRTPPPTLLRGLQQLVPRARLTYDAAGKRLLVVAPPAEQKIVKQALERFEQTAPPEQPNRLVSYAVTAAQRKRFEAVLPSVRAELPDIRVITDAEPGELSIWAKPTQHEVIGRIIEQLKRDVPAEQKYRLVAYQITLADPANVLVVMRQLFPGTQLTLDSKTKRLLAWAGSEEHKKIKAAMEEIDSNVPADVREKLMVYPMADVDPQVAITVLQHLVPDARLTPDSTAGTMVAWAREADHKIIARTIKDMQVGPGAAHKPRIEVYSTGDGDPTVIGRMLRTLVPTARITPDPQKGAVAAWATPKEHEVIRAAIEKMARREDAETAPAVATYSLGTTPLHSAMRVLRAVVPRAQIAVGAEPDQLVVWARPADHKRIEQIVEQLTETGSGETARKVAVYPLVATTASKAIQVLGKAVPGATLNVGSDPYQLVAWARPADHETIKRIVEELSKKAPAEEAAKVVVYTLESTNAWGAIAILRPQFPQAHFSAGTTDPYQLIVSARPADHERIKQVVEELSKEEPAEKAAKVVVYTLESVAAWSAIRVLQPQFPQARFSAGTDPYQLIAWARPADHERIKQVVEELSKKAPAEKAAKVVVYTLESTTARIAIPVLQSQFRQARFSAGTDPYQLIVSARPADHERIKQVVEELSKEAPADKAAKVVVYTLQTRLSYTAIRGLREAFPQARFTSGADPRQLIVLARPSDHEKIKDLIEQMSKKETAPSVVIYRLKSAGAAQAVKILGVAFPEAKFTTGANQKSVIAWARPDEHVLIKTAVDRIEAAGSPDDDRVMAVHSMKAEDAASLLQVLDPLLKKHARFVTAPDRDSLIVWADKEHQAVIKRAVEQFLSELPELRKPVSEVYYFRTADPREAMTVLRALVPTARMAANIHNRSLVVSALAEDQEKIKEAVEQIDREVVDTQAPRLQSHRIVKADPVKLFDMLKTFYRRRGDVQLTLDEENDTIMAIASPTEHENIQSLIRQVEAGASPETTAGLFGHTARKGAGAGADVGRAPEQSTGCDCPARPTQNHSRHNRATPD
jgi:type II secretory pathway component GspD/PulD (secretin)